MKNNRVVSRLMIEENIKSLVDCGWSEWNISDGKMPPKGPVSYILYNELPISDEIASAIGVEEASRLNWFLPAEACNRIALFKELNDVKSEYGEYGENNGPLKPFDEEAYWAAQHQKTTQDAVNPKHYKEILPGYEYFDIMDHVLIGWEGSQAHALGQAYKYIMRLGKKDDPVQELDKAIWYLNRLKEDIKNKGKL